MRFGSLLCCTLSFCASVGCIFGYSLGSDEYSDEYVEADGEPMFDAGDSSLSMISSDSPDFDPAWFMSAAGTDEDYPLDMSQEFDGIGAVLHNLIS